MTAPAPPPPVHAFATTHDLADDLGLERRAVALEQATDMIRAEVGQDIAPSVRETVTIMGTGRRLFQLPQIPVTAVHSLTVFGQPLTVNIHWSWQPDGYVFRLYNLWAPGVPIVVDYTHGYAEVPAELTRMCAALADKILAGTIELRQVSESVGSRSRSMTYSRASDSVFSEADRKILGKYQPVPLP